MKPKKGREGLVSYSEVNCKERRRKFKIHIYEKKIEDCVSQRRKINLTGTWVHRTFMICLNSKLQTELQKTE